MLYTCIFYVALLMDLFVLVCLTTRYIRNIFGCGCYFVVECYGGVECGWRCSVGYTVYGLPNNVSVLCL